MKKLTTEQWIEKARAVHGDKFDYSKVDYQGNNKKITIICPIHGEFQQVAADHLKSKYGCPKCAKNNKLTTEEFIKKAKLVHGEKYEYSKVNYIDSQTKICIICPIHGEFEQRPTDHLLGKGCPKCNGTIKYTNESFIEKAKLIHGNKYDYSKINYININTPITIICSKHGEFQLRPAVHLRGGNCPLCMIELGKYKSKKTLEYFIKEVKNIYGDKYDYSKVKYISDLTKVCVICHEKDEFDEEHGEFWVTPNNFLRGRKCPKCSKRVKLTNEIFLKKAKLIHGDKYDYSGVDVHGVDTKVTIICPEHGEFQQTPYKHMLGQGCPECSKKQRGLSCRITQEEFIRRAKETHGDYYDYSKVNYLGIDTKVEIICPKHGSFWQTPYSHTKQKSGCPKCYHSKLEEDIIKLLEENKINYEYCIRTIPFLNGLELDFYIPELNIGIECQGELHFKPVDFNGQGLDIATNNYWKQVGRDKIKKELCDKNGINLLYYSNLGIEYPYKVYENVNEILKIIKNE